jgi:hypothetical protein
MSKTQFVSFGNRGFWAYDVALSIFLKYLIDAAEESSQADSVWITGAVSDWRIWACVPDLGFTVNEHWSASQRQEFVALAEVANAKLVTRESIPAEEIVRWEILEDLHIFPRGETEVLTAPVVELGEAIIALVSGRLPETPEGQTWYYGTPVGRQTRGRHR